MFNPFQNFRNFSVLAIAAAAMIALLTPLDALAQDNSDSANPDTAPRRARRNDAYKPTDTGPSLGTLSGPGSRPEPTTQYGGGYSSQASPQAGDGYAPRYSEPVRPYGATNDAPAGNGYGEPSEQYRPAPPPSNSQGPAPYGRTYAQGQSQPYYSGGGNGQPNGGGAPGQASGYGQPYNPPDYNDRRPRDGYGAGPRDEPYGHRDGERGDGTYSSNEIMSAGHRFFGSISQGLASVVENAFKRQGRPNGYILGEEAGGAFIAGLRYGEGVLYTRDAGSHRVYWQGPSVGYDVGGAGSKVMVLVYNLRDPNDIYERFGGVDGSAYFVGGVGMTVLTRDHITLAPIRTGVGLRLGANVGYLKFTPRATWNPF